MPRLRAPAFGAEVAPHAGRDGRFATTGACWCDSPCDFGAEPVVCADGAGLPPRKGPCEVVLPVACPDRFGAEAARRSASDCILPGNASAPAGCVDRSARAAAPCGFASGFGAEVCSALAVRPAVRRARRGRRGSWRSSPSFTSRPTSCPSVMCGLMWDSSPLSCSSPRWHSSSITAFTSQRPPLSARIRSAGTTRSGSTSDSICITCRVLFPAASFTSAFRADASSSGGGTSAGADGADPLGFTAAPTPASPPRAARVRSRSRRSKAACNCAAASSVSEPSRSRSRAPSTCAHSFMALIRRHAAAAL